MNKRKISHEKTREICGYMSTGSTITLACRMAGISRKSYQLWKSRWLLAKEKRKADRRYQFTDYELLCKDFWEQSQIAEAKSEYFLLQKLYESDNWQAAKWLLCVRWPRKYNEQKLDDQKPMKILITEGDATAADDSLNEVA
jgi:hypothetical protein